MLTYIAIDDAVEAIDDRIKGGMMRATAPEAELLPLSWRSDLLFSRAPLFLVLGLFAKSPNLVGFSGFGFSMGVRALLVGLLALAQRIVETEL